jgi:hypothetical protein
MPRSRVPGRRRFLKAAGLAGLSSALAPNLVALAQSVPPPAGAAAPAKTGGAKADSTAATPAAPEISEDARDLARIVQRRYGEHLTSDQLEDVTRELSFRVEGGKRLRAAKLANGDEPDFTFRP